MPEEYRVGELAEKAGVTRRTIHYYVGKGLLPQPEGAGLGTVYSDEHYYRLLLIKKLQSAFLPLDEIRKRITSMSREEVMQALGKEAATVKAGEETEPYLSQKSLGIAYERINVGFGLEINFPRGNRKAGDLAGKLYKYAEKIMKEGL